MVKQDYQKALAAARTEMQQLLKQREETDARISQLKKTIEGLAALCGEQPEYMKGLREKLPAMFDSIGISDAIRELLFESTTPMFATRLRDALIARGIDLSRYANELAVIHNTLKRLEGQGDIQPVAGGFVLTEKGRNAVQAARTLRHAFGG